MTLLIQAAMPGWVGPTAALSLVIIALSFAAIALALLAAGRAALGASSELREEIHGLREEIGPALQAVNRVAGKVEGISDQVGGEIREVLETSRRTRYDFERGLARAKDRLEDFDALVEVVQEEVEETALDATAAIRTVRTAGGAVGLLRRLLVRGRR
jgi:methyl-accepting chemotaxis protein